MTKNTLTPAQTGVALSKPLLFFRRAFRSVVGKVIGLVAYVDHRLYTRLQVAHLKRLGMRVEGMPIYIARSVYFDGTDYGIISVGDKVVMSTNVSILTHDYSIARAVEACGHDVDKEVAIVRPVTIGANSFVGRGAILLPGTTLGESVIVGAGSVVRGSIPAFSIVVGNPGQVVGDVRHWAKAKLEGDPTLREAYFGQRSNMQ